MFRNKTKNAICVETQMVLGPIKEIEVFKINWRPKKCCKNLFELIGVNINISNFA